MDISFTRYAAGGGRAQDGVHFNVNDYADLPDSDAGTDLAGCYRSDPRYRKIREAVEHRHIPLGICAAVLAVVFIFCSIAVSVRLSHLGKVQNEMNVMASEMAQTMQKNQVLAKRVEEAQDLSRIGYMAVKRLGMVASDDQNNIVLYMPEVALFAGTVTHGDTASETDLVTTASAVTEDAALENARAER